MIHSGTSDVFLPYAGDVTAKEAWKIITQNPEATLVDVRTDAEWNQVGVPDLSSHNKPVVKCSWRILPSREINSAFVASVMQSLPDRSAPVYFLCKGGGRSREAAMAMTELGYTQCYNVAGGFEGAEGWKASALPWNIDTDTSHSERKPA